MLHALIRLLISPPPTPLTKRALTAFSVLAAMSATAYFLRHAYETQEPLGAVITHDIRINCPNHATHPDTPCPGKVSAQIRFVCVRKWLIDKKWAPDEKTIHLLNSQLSAGTILRPEDITPRALALPAK